MTIKIEFEEITLCPHCESRTEEKFSGDEGATFCTDGCGCLEGDNIITKYLCSICGDYCDEPKCENENCFPEESYEQTDP